MNRVNRDDDLLLDHRAGRRHQRLDRGEERIHRLGRTALEQFEVGLRHGLVARADLAGDVL